MQALHFRKYSTASDVWSFGCVMYEIWSLGHKPFESYSNIQVLISPYRLSTIIYTLPSNECIMQWMLCCLYQAMQMIGSGYISPPPTSWMSKTTLLPHDQMLVGTFALKFNHKEVSGYPLGNRYPGYPMDSQNGKECIP